MATQTQRVASHDPDTDPRKTILSPGEIEAIGQDPAKIAHVARLMGAVHLDNLFRTMQNPSVSAQAKLDFMKLLNSLAGFGRDADRGATGPQVVVNITRAADDDATVVISGTATELPREDDEDD